MRFTLLFFLAMPASALTISVLPEPMSVQSRDGAFTLQSSTRITADSTTLRTASMLARWLAPATGFTFTPRVAADSDNAINLKVDPSLDHLGDEGYTLDVTPQRITIRAPHDAGVFYGVQTLRQLLPPQIFSPEKQSVDWTVPAVFIEDKPRFAWRGAMLDVSRHFMPKDFVLRFIDLLALHKLNTFHWHLTDDQGWRIEIKKYPKLTTVGAWRKQTRLGHEHNPHGFDNQPHGGFYTQQDIREVVEYARQRHITIVPEIEMPGHAQAAIAAYPYLGVTGQPLEVWSQWGVNPNIFNPNERTIHFLQDVLTEVLALFPGKFIHVGGDEAIKDEWKASPEVQARIKALGLKDENAMQSYFTHRMDEFLASKGRRLIGWDEILEGGLAPGATVMSWRGTEGGITAAKAGHDVVMAPTTNTYLDYYQSRDPNELFAIGGFLPLETVYEFDPIATLTPDEARHVLGTQAQLWTEYMLSPGHVEYMAFPRLVALSEVAWTELPRKNYGDFLARLATHQQRLQQLNVNFRPLDNPIAAPAGFSLRSSAFAEGQTLPDNTVLKGLDCNGANISPPLEWMNAPAGTRSFAIVMDDFQARYGDGFAHWAVYNIPSNVTTLPANAGANEGDIPGVGRHAYNDFLKRNYGGPCPPEGPPHLYRFTVYALDLPSIDDAGTPMTWRKLRAVMRGHILGEASLTGIRGH